MRWSMTPTRPRPRRRAKLAGQGHLLRLWRLPPGGPGALGLWRAQDLVEMQAIVRSLPLDPG